MLRYSTFKVLRSSCFSTSSNQFCDELVADLVRICMYISIYMYSTGTSTYTYIYIHSNSTNSLLTLYELTLLLNYES